MPFLEEFEKTIFIVPIVALLVALGFGLLGVLAGIIASTTLGLSLVGAIKLGVLGGFVFGGAIGVFVVLAYLFKKVTSK